MKRPRTWLSWVLLACLAVAVTEYLVLMWVIPQYVLLKLEQLAQGKLTVSKIQLVFPFTTVLSGVRLATNTPQAAFSIQRVVIAPRWASLKSKTIWIDTLELDRPMLRMMRTATGTVLWPSMPQAAAPIAQRRRRWQLQIGQLKLVDGTIELIDEKLSVPFHGALDHLSIIMGPVTIPESPSNTSFAIRGELIGHAGHAAPVYCSGWVATAERDLEGSCQLEPLALAAFDPYFHGTPEVRVYTTTLGSTSRWSARSNELSVRVQLELDHLSEGDLSIHGRTIIDAKRLSSGEPHTLSGEMHLTGSLDTLQGWRAEFLPGDDRVQQLVGRLLEHGAATIRVRLWGQEVYLSLMPGSQAAMSDIQAASKEVREALEILAVPPPEAVPEAEALTPPQPAAAPVLPPTEPPTPLESPAPPLPPS